MEITAKKIEAYCEAGTSPHDDLLHYIYRQTHLKTTQANMLSGHLQGRFLSMVAQMLQPLTIVEVGTFTGYATLCLLEGLHHEGTLYTFEIDPEREGFLEEVFAKAERGQNISLYMGNAAERLAEVKASVDLAFIDADKENYALYYDLLKPRMSKNGIILVDNVLWKGKVTDEASGDKKTSAIKAFNEKVKNDDEVTQVILPLRDGLMMIRLK